MTPAARRLVRGALFVACLAPLGALGWRALHGDLGANPIEAAEIETGVWTLRFLAATLAMSPLRRLTGQGELIRYRRMLGLFTFAYACVHLTTYVGVDWFFDFGAIGHDIVKHPYVTVGMAGFLLLVPLAVTSTREWIRRLGGRRWAALHRLAYAVPVCGVVHYMWAVKKDVRHPLAYGAAFALLLGWRLATWLGARAARAARGSSEERPAARATA